jgi:hypothetical protein
LMGGRIVQKDNFEELVNRKGLFSNPYILIFGSHPLK